MVRRPTGEAETSLQRIARRAEEDRQHNRAGFEAILDGIEELRTEVRRGAQNTGLLEQRFNALEFQVNLTRDEVQRSTNTSRPSQVASAKTAISDAARSPMGKLVIGATGFVAIVSALNNTPDAVRAAERFWAFLAGRDVKALEVVVPPSPNPPLSEK